ncbi:MAG: phosphatase PAP2 family protein [Salaquimonas sp.]|nr:phosphatase PAP2 family protein [Salaquimonas sp.]
MGTPDDSTPDDIRPGEATPNRADRRPFWTHLPGGRETAMVAIIAFVLGLATAIVFTAWPQFDIAVSRLFFSGDVFPMTQEWFWRFLRTVFLNGFTAWYILITVGCVVTFKQQPALLGFDFRKWLYLAICSIGGPLLLVNIILKDHWGRWRPREIIQLGGEDLHTTPLDWSGTCIDNCSFVSGEVASMVMAFIALAFVTTAWRPIFYALAIFMGLLEALIRVGQGGHFISDALFAGVFMVLVAAAIYWAMFLYRDRRSRYGRLPRP